MGRHTKNKEIGLYKCSLCKIFCKSSDELKYHMPCCGPNVNACTLCGKGFTNFLDIYIHVEEHYGKIFAERQPFFGECCFCNQACRTRNELLSHLHSHVGEKPFICCICKRRFTYKRNLLVHMNGHEAKLSKKIMKACPLCKIKFSELVDYCDHMQSHSTSTLACNFCDRIFVFEVSLKEHMKLHKGAKETDSGTGEDSIGRPQKKSYSKRHHACRMCKRIFRFKSHLETHLKIQHKNELAGSLGIHASSNKKINIQINSDIICCQFCEFKTTSRLGIQNHMRHHDKNKSLFPCQMCNQKFSLKLNLKRHMLVSCRGGNSTCPSVSIKKEVFKDVIQRNKLGSHITKPHVCRKCGKTFVHQQAFMKHCRFHSRAPSDCRLPASDQKEKRKERPEANSSVISLGAKQTVSSRSSIVNRVEASTTNAESYICDKCGRIFIYRKSFVKHCCVDSDHKSVVGQEHDIKTQKLQPDSSLLVSNAGNSLVSSSYNSAPKIVCQTYTCKVCQLSFRRKCNFLRHLAVHKNFKSFVCDNCTQHFRDEKALVKHWELHHMGESLCFIENVPEVEERQPLDGISPINMDRADAKHLEGRECTYLRTEVTIRSEEKTHAALKQELDVRINCVLCGAKFGTSEDLICHIESLESCVPNIGIVQEIPLKAFTVDDRVEKFSKTQRPQVKQIPKKYVCDICQKEFKSEKFLERHSSSAHFKGRAYKYNKFSRRFIGKRFLAVHRNKHPREVPFPCNICRRPFKTKKMLSKHTEIHRQELKTKYKRSDEKHQQEKDTNRQQEAPSYSGVASLLLGRDDKIYSGNGMFAGEKTPSVIRLGEDAESSTRDGTLHPCDVCGQTFNCDHQLRRHHLVSHVKGGGFGCMLCSKQFSSKQKLLRHLNAHRTNSSHTTSLKFHVQEIQANGTESQVGIQANYACSICKETYEAENALWYHYVSSHVENRYECPYCNKRFCYKFNVLSHMRCHMTSCDICGYYTPGKKGDSQTAASELIDSEEHVEIHEKGCLIQDNIVGDRQVTCSVCKKALKKKKNIMHHILLTHGNKSYSCKICGKEFCSKLALGRHTVGKQCKISNSKKLQKNSKLLNSLCNPEIDNGENMASDAGKEVNKHENPSESAVLTYMTGRCAEFLNPSHVSEENQSADNSVQNNSSECFPTISSNLIQEEQVHHATEMPESSFALDNVAPDSINVLNEGSFCSDEDDAEEYNSNEYSVSSNVRQNKEAIPLNEISSEKSSTPNFVSRDETIKKQDAYKVYKEKSNALDQPGANNPPFVNHRLIACLVCSKQFFDIEVYLMHYPCLGIGTKSDVVVESETINKNETKELEHEYYENVSDKEKDHVESQYDYAGLGDVNSVSPENCAEETAEQEGLDSMFYFACCNKRSLHICPGENPIEHTGEITPNSHVYADSIASSTHGCNTTVTFNYADNIMSEIQQVSNNTDIDVCADFSTTICKQVSTETSTPVGTRGITVNGSKLDIMCPALNVVDSASESPELHSDISGNEDHPYSDGSDTESPLLHSGNSFSTNDAVLVHKSNSESTVVDIVGDFVDFRATSSLSIRDCATLNTSESLLVNKHGSCNGKLLNTLVSPYCSKSVSCEEHSLYEKRLDDPRRYTRGTVTIVAQNSRIIKSQETSGEEITVKFSRLQNYRIGRTTACIENEAAAANLCEFLIVDNWMGS